MHFSPIRQTREVDMYPCPGIWVVSKYTHYITPPLSLSHNHGEQRATGSHLRKERKVRELGNASLREHLRPLVAVIDYQIVMPCLAGFQLPTARRHVDCHVGSIVSCRGSLHQEAPMAGMKAANTSSMVPNPPALSLSLSRLVPFTTTSVGTPRSTSTSHMHLSCRRARHIARRRFGRQPSCPSICIRAKKHGRRENALPALCYF